MRNNSASILMATAFFIVAGILFGLFFVGIFKNKSPISDQSITNFDECAAAGNPVMESWPRQCRAGDETFVENIGNEFEKLNLIRINTPRPNQEISSPLTVEGVARGYWFFEGDFSVKLLDKNNNLIGKTILSTQGEWMTEEFVPFKGELVFTSPSQKGLLILEKDNPSGLLENDDQLIVPVHILEN